MQGIYTYIPETNDVPREYTVAAILSLLFIIIIYYYYYYYYFAIRPPYSVQSLCLNILKGRLTTCEAGLLESYLWKL
jgi:hypothetical protein